MAWLMVVEKAGNLMDETKYRVLWFEFVKVFILSGDAFSVLLGDAACAGRGGHSHLR